MDYAEWVAAVDELRAEVDGMHGAVRDAVRAVVTELGDLGEDMGRYADVLDGAGASLNCDLKPEDLNQLITELAQETRRTRQRSAEVEASLQAMAEEFAELRAKFDALSEDSLTDSLTGIANRRAFDEAMRRLTKLGKELLI